MLRFAGSGAAHLRRWQLIVAAAAVAAVVLVAVAAPFEVGMPSSSVPTEVVGDVSASAASAGVSATAGAATGEWVTFGSGPVQPRPPASARAVVTGWHVPVLMYHHIGTGWELGKDRTLPGLDVAPALFDAQMALLHAAGWRAITAAQLGIDLLTGHRPPPRTFVATFDDGHEDAFLNAFPALAANGFVATFFVITGDIDRGVALRAFEVTALAAAGMEIADHTVHHAPLALVAPAVATREIDGAATWIRRWLGAAPSTFAYPYGNEDPAVVADLAADGFSVAFTNREGCFESTATRFLIPRLRVGPGTTPRQLLAAVNACGYP